MNIIDKKDPRTKIFYRLAKQDITQLDNDELVVLVEISIKMEKFVIDPKGRRSWNQYRNEITKILGKNKSIK